MRSPILSVSLALAALVAGMCMLIPLSLVFVHVFPVLLALFLLGTPVLACSAGIAFFRFPPRDFWNWLPLPDWKPKPRPRPAAARTKTEAAEEEMQPSEVQIAA